MSNAAVRSLEPDNRPRPDARSLGDQELCDLVRRGPQSLAGREAFTELYSRHREPALAQALSMTRDRGAAEDLVAETFTRVLQALSNGKGPTDSVLGYVLISLRSEAIRVRQSAAGEVPVAPDVLTELFDEPVVSEVDGLGERDQIGRAYQTLSEDARRVLWLLEVEGVSAETASEHLGVRAGTVRMMALRARNKLAAAYLQQYVETTNPECVPVAGLLAEHVRGQLGKRDATHVEQHLPGCPQCRIQESRLRDLGQQLRVWAGPLIIGSSLASGAALSGSGAPAASAASPAATTPATGHTEGASGVGKIMGWVGLAAGIALLIAGAFVLFPRDATGTPTSPTTNPDAPAATSPGSGMPGNEAAEDTTPGTSRPEIPPSGNPDPLPENSPELPDAEPTVSPDDTTPNWELRD